MATSKAEQTLIKAIDAAIENIRSNKQYDWTNNESNALAFVAGYVGDDMPRVRGAIVRLMTTCAELEQQKGNKQ